MSGWVVGGFCGYGGSVWVMGEWAVGHWLVGVTSFQKIYGSYGQKHEIVEIRPQRSQEFQTGTGWDFAKSRDGINLFFHPGVFQDGISLIFSSRDILERNWFQNK